MLKRALATCFALVASAAAADTPMKPYTRAILSNRGTCLATLVPGEYRVEPDDRVTTLREPRMTAYRLGGDGSFRRAWELAIPYNAFHYIGDDCRQLVVVNPVAREVPRPTDVALEFYVEAKRVRIYYVPELVEDPSRFERTVSSRGWTRSRIDLRNDRYDWDAEMGLSVGEFRLKTTDDVIYIFDAETGNIKERFKR